MMSRYAAFVFFLASGIVFQLSCGTEVNVTKDDKLCLFANLMLNFSVSYEVTGNKNETVMFELPENVTTEGSKCDTTSSTLKLNFGGGHSWTVDFTAKGENYQADLITFFYNLSDSSRFPNSVSNETETATVRPQITNVGMDTCYSCKSKDESHAGPVTMTLWNVLIQAFVNNGSKSERITSCAADMPTTPVPPTTHVTSTTTAAPVTNTTSTASTPTSTPTPTLPTPTTGHYNISSDVNSTVCLMAVFGLRIAFKQGEKYQEMNLDPNGTKVSGSCGVNSSELVLVSNSMTIMFTFTNDTKKFHLSALNVTVKTSSGLAFSDVSTNLSLWEASVGSSYMCNKEQSDNITSQLTLHTFNLRVQPFGVKNNNFSTADECFLDSDLSFLVPIAVGVALSFLIILVLISYLIGRRKSRTGYQSV